VVKWNSPSEVLYCDFVEQFSANAFSESLSSGADVRALFEHDHTKLLGRTRAGTLKLEEDAIGLRFELMPPDTTLGRDLLVSVERGDISGMSFGFWAKEETWNFDVEPCQRTVAKAELFEITVTSIPAYPESSVEIAKRSRATPRIALRLLKRIRDFAEVNDEQIISHERAKEGLNALGVNSLGFDEMDIRYLEILMQARRRPMGLSTIAAALSEDEGTIEDVIEPYLLANGYIEKTAKGRIATDKAREALGRMLKTAERNLFEE